MEQDDIRGSDDQSLARLMDLGLPGGELWSSQELGAILRHQLVSSLQVDLAIRSDSSLQRALARSAKQHPPIRTFGELLFHEQPPFELLERAKEFAKSCRTGPTGAIPDEIATVLYALTIAAALVRCHQRITQLDDPSIGHMIEWALEQSWLDGMTTELLQKALEIVHTKEDRF